jgi:hypothetical protein
MRTSAHSQCLELTKKFISDPLCSSVFLAPVDLGSDAANDDYRRIIKHPMDLTTLLSNLKDRDYYQNVHKWAHDFQLIFDNAITYNGANSYLAGIARYFRAKLDRHVAQIAARSEFGLPALIGPKYGSLLDLLSRPPSSSELKPSVPPIEALGTNFSDPALDVLTKKLNRFVSSETKDDLRRILGQSPENDKELSEVDVGELPAQTVAELWDFVRKNENAT